MVKKHWKIIIGYILVMECSKWLFGDDTAVLFAIYGYVMVVYRVAGYVTVVAVV